MNTNNSFSESGDEASKLKVLAKKKENVRRKLAVTAEKLSLKAKQSLVTAKKKESIRHKLAVTAANLRLKAKQLAVTAREKESVRRKLAVTAKDLEQARKNLSLKAKQLAVTAREKESVRRKLAVTAENLSLKAKQLAVIAEEKENVRLKLMVTTEELVEAKAKDEALLESIGDGIVATDKEGKVILMNKVAEGLLGFTSAEMLGKFFDHIIFAQDAEGHDIPSKSRPITAALSSGKTTTTTIATTEDGQAAPATKAIPRVYYYVRKDKTKFPIAVTVAPVRLEHKIIGTIAVFHDITQEREIDKAKTEFVSLASHQLRTPLSTVRWYTEMLLSGDAGQLNDKQKKYLDEVYKGNHRMVVLVNALLNVSRLELGTFVVDPEPTDVVKLIQKVIDEFKLQIDKKQFKFSERHSEGLPLLNADPKLLSMVFQNLLANVIKYTPNKGKISIEMRIVKCGELIDTQTMQEDSIAVVLADNGFGIPKNQQSSIFTKLFRADNVREKDAEGTGLGLYIVKSIIDHSGGMVWFESEENKGTTFYVILPLVGMRKKAGNKALE